MIAVQMIRVGVGDETIHVPVFRLPYLGGRDARTTRGGAQLGGFFVTAEGDYGVAVDGAVPADEVTAFATAQLRENLPELQALVRAQFARLSRGQPSAVS
jgi:hypothetical protein